MTANRDGHDKFQFFWHSLIHIIMTKSKAMKAMTSCLGLRRTCFWSSHLTFYDPCWKLIAFSQTDLAPCKTRSSGWKYHCRLLDYQSPVKVPFGSFVFSSFFSLSMYKISENLLWVRTSCGHLENIWKHLEIILWTSKEHLRTPAESILRLCGSIWEHL